MRYLGIDYGTKRIGLAVSDDEGLMAYPFKILDVTHDVIQRLVNLVEEEKIDEIVIGLSQNEKGEDNAIMQQVNDLVAQISLLKEVPIHLEREAFSSVEASRLSGYDGLPKKNQDNQRGRQKGKEHVDDSAAAVILQRFLDKK